MKNQNWFTKVVFVLAVVGVVATLFLNSNLKTQVAKGQETVSYKVFMPLIISPKQAPVIQPEYKMYTIRIIGGTGNDANWEITERLFSTMPITGVAINWDSSNPRGTKNYGKRVDSDNLEQHAMRLCGKKCIDEPSLILPLYRDEPYSVEICPPDNGVCTTLTERVQPPGN